MKVFHNPTLNEGGTELITQESCHFENGSAALGDQLIFEGSEEQCRATVAKLPITDGYHKDWFNIIESFLASQPKTLLTLTFSHSGKIPEYVQKAFGKAVYVGGISSITFYR